MKPDGALMPITGSEADFSESNSVEELEQKLEASGVNSISPKRGSVV